jgi:signal transduction histidine kinase
MSARYSAAGRPEGASLVQIREQQDVVDRVVQDVRSKAGGARDALGTIGQSALDHVLARLNELGTLRQTAVNSQLPPLPTIEKYSLVIGDLLVMYQEIVQGTANEELAASASALGALAREQEEASVGRALLAAALARRFLPAFDPTELDAFTAAQARRDSEHNSFVTTATQAQRQLYSDTVNGQKFSRALFLESRAITLSQRGQPLRRLDSGDDAVRWFDAMRDTIDRMHTVEDQIARGMIAKSDELQSSDQGFALINIILVAGLLIIVLVVTSVMARSLVRPLRRLRTEALEVAGNRLPSLVQRLRESDATAGSAEVRPIGVASADEIGEVARAFDEVHREAVRLAGDEAALRSNISAMFVNLSRRTQTLVERQITLIDGLEQGEQDENRLGNLFKLDHLATRMRRNSENLLVLAGQEPARRWSQPVPLVDVVRAALSEVESYERVDMQIPPGIAVAGQAVNDIIHLLAELVENAISFSSRDTKVIVTGNRIDGGGVMIGITDNGIGMTAQELSQANWRLSNPPVVDVSVSRRMGLFVVGRLALRHGVRVQLRPHDAGGLTAMVLLPEQLVGTQSQAAMPYAPPAMAGSLAAAAPVSALAWDRPAELGSGPGSGGSLFSSAQPALEGASGRPPAGQGFGAPPQGQGFDGFDGFEGFGGSVPGMSGQSSFGTPPPGQGFGGPAPAASGQGYPPQGQGFPPQGQGFPPPSQGFPPPSQSFPPPSDSFQPAAQGFGSPAPPGQGFGSPPGQGYGGPPPGQGFGGAPPAPGQGFGGGPSAPGQGFGGMPPAGPGFGQHDGGPLGAARPRARRFDFPDTDIASTGPMPVVHDSPMDQQGDEFLPIFAAVESAWFRRAPETPVTGGDESDSGGWQTSSADAGWQAAAVVREPVREGKTASGLPKRVPKANLVPGSVDTSRQTSMAPPMPALSPDRARSRLSSFQQGIRQGRAVARGELGEEDAYPGSMPMQSRADDNKEDA